MVSADGETRLVEPPDFAPPLGLIGMADDVARPLKTHFGPGDQLLLYTDGVIEARDENREFYPLQERAYLLQAVDPEEALAKLQGDLVEHVGGPVDDDAAMLLLRRRIR